MRERKREKRGIGGRRRREGREREYAGDNGETDEENRPSTSSLHLTAHRRKRLCVYTGM